MTITEPGWCPVPDPTLNVPEVATDFRPKSLARRLRQPGSDARSGERQRRTAIAVHKRQSLYYQVFLDLLGALVAMAICACFIHQFHKHSLRTTVCVAIALAAGSLDLTQKPVLSSPRKFTASSDQSALPASRGFLPLAIACHRRRKEQIPAVNTAGEEEDASE